MYAIPFVYFTALTIYWWKKHNGLDVCVYISSLYAIVSFCAVIIVLNGLLDSSGILFDEYNAEFGIAPTFLYCFLVTLGIIPFSLIYRKDIKKIPEPSSLLLEGFCWLLIAVFFLTIYLIADSTVEILSGDLSTVRADHNKGIESPADIKAETLPFFIRLFFYFNTSAYLALPLFFYYTCFSNRPWWFKALLLGTSLTIPLKGLQTADRTEFTFYGMMFIYCLIFFWKFLSAKFKRGMFIIGTPLVCTVLVYIVAVTQARFADDNDNDGAYESALQYAGQGYLNFCYFWEHGKFQYISPEREFPMTWHTLFHVESNADRRAERSGEQGFFMSVFASYVGDIMLDLSPIGVIIWSLVFSLVAICLIRYSHREEYDIGDILAIFYMAGIPIFGIFYYKYYSFNCFFMLMSVVLLYIISKVKIEYK